MRASTLANKEEVNERVVKEKERSVSWVFQSLMSREGSKRIFCVIRTGLRIHSQFPCRNAVYLHLPFRST